MAICPKSVGQERNGEKAKHKAINDWATLPSALKKLMPKTIFKYKLKQFLLNHFNLS